VNDKVMQIRNNYDKEVFNGDIGRITALSAEDRELTVVFDGRAVAYDFSDLDEIVHAYAVSVHKAQGSEYPAVIFPVLTQHYILLQRNLIYTAVTRARLAGHRGDAQSSCHRGQKHGHGPALHTALRAAETKRYLNDASYMSFLNFLGFSGSPDNLFFRLS
jgi:hypothetical protein